jgi:1-acyl-sn-glycerol-3-phosphate acyltransferase
MIRIICIYCVWVFAKIFYHHKVYGKENIPPGGGIIAPNHCSFWDPPLVGISCPDKIHFLARDTLFHFAPFAWLIRQLNTHPVKSGAGNLSTLKTALEFVQSGKKVVIFPEGKRSSDGQLHKGQLGVGMLVQRARCQVIPVYIHGTFEAWNSHRKFPKFSGRTACIFGKPIPYLESSLEDKKMAQAEIVDTIMAKIADLRSWYLAGAHGTPP